MDSPPGARTSAAVAGRPSLGSCLGTSAVRRLGKTAQGTESQSPSPRITRTWCNNLRMAVNPGEGLELFYHSQVACGAVSEKHSSLGTKLCCVRAGGRWIGYTKGCF